MITSKDDQVNIESLTAQEIEKLKFDNFYNNQNQTIRKNNLTDMLVNMDEKSMANR